MAKIRTAEMSDPSSFDQSRPFENYLAAVAAIGCLALTTAVWWGVSTMQTMWPLPALYLIEVATAAVVAAIAFIRAGQRGRRIAWAVVGVLVAFSLLGLFTVGALYLPTVLILGGVCLTADLRNKSPLGPHLVIFLLGALTQSAVMLTVSRLVP